MQILCVSDKVAPELYPQIDRQRFGKVDLLVSCGDLPPEYLIHLADAFEAPLYYVCGNHDIRYANRPPRGCKNIHGRIVRRGPLKILGLEGSRWYNGGPHQYTEGQMRHLVWRLRPKIWWAGGVDLIVTHAPPRYLNDAEDLCHRGFKTFRRLIDWYTPRYFVHGHIHAYFAESAERFAQTGSTQVINCFGYYRLEIDDAQPLK